MRTAVRDAFFRPAVGVPRTIVLAFLAHCCTSLIHFVHNAVYLHDYPNLPDWLTATGVYGSWVALTGVGVVGLSLYRYFSVRAGLAVLIAYAMLGFAGLDHYAVAPASAHTLTMNLTIGLETLTAMALLIAVIRQAIRCYRAAHALIAPR